MENQRDWNINKGFGDILTGLIDDVNKSAREGDVKLWFNSLRILYRNVAGHKKMDKEVMKILNTDLKDVAKKLDVEPALTGKGKALQHTQKSKVKNTLDEINISLITEMHKGGLILPIHKTISPENAALQM